MITIKKGDIGDYHTLFEQYRTYFTDKCAQSSAKSGQILIAYLEGLAAGYLLTNAEHGSEFIMYVFTLPQLRGKGVMQSLVLEAVNNSYGYIGTAFTDAHEFAPVLIHVMEKYGFVRGGTKYMFRCDGDDLWDRWDAFMEKRAAGYAIHSVIRVIPLFCCRTLRKICSDNTVTLQTANMLIRSIISTLYCPVQKLPEM